MDTGFLAICGVTVQMYLDVIIKTSNNSTNTNH